MSFHADQSAEAQVLGLLGMKPTLIRTGVEASELWLSKTDQQLTDEARGLFRAPDVSAADSPEAMRAQAEVEARFSPAKPAG